MFDPKFIVIDCYCTITIIIQLLCYYRKLKLMFVKMKGKLSKGYIRYQKHNQNS